MLREATSQGDLDLDSSSPLDPVLGSTVLQHQPLVAFLQVSCRQVQLLVNFGVLVVHLPQEIHLLGQVLQEAIQTQAFKYLLIRQTNMPLHNRHCLELGDILNIHNYTADNIQFSNFLFGFKD